jgi:hypothetical protein
VCSSDLYDSLPHNGVDVELTEVTLNPVIANAEHDETIPVAAPFEGNGKIIELRVLDIKGRTYKFRDLPYDMTVGELKAHIERNAGVEASLQRLIYGGRQLGVDSQTLHEAHIRNDTVLHVFQRPNVAAVPQPPSATPVAIQTASRPSLFGHARLDIGGDPDDPELEMATRRVRFLALLLTVLSGMNSIMYAIFFVNATFSDFTAEQWCMLAAQGAMNLLGLYVGRSGLEVTTSLDQARVKHYCCGLLVVGTLFVSTDLFRLTRALGGRPQIEVVDEPPAPDPNPVSAAAWSLALTVAMWAYCFIRAFQFRDRLARAARPELDVPAAEAVPIGEA